jgi:hypothetical protein
VDGALRSAGSQLVGEEDTTWCFCHQTALPVKKSLEGNSGIALDFTFMHQFGVYVFSHAVVAEMLDRFRRANHGSELRLLMDSLARWTSEFRKVKRFLDMQDELMTLGKVKDVNVLLKEWVDEKESSKRCIEANVFCPFGIDEKSAWSNSYGREDVAVCFGAKHGSFFLASY